jgi:hypothetical protein
MSASECVLDTAALLPNARWCALVLEGWNTRMIKSLLQP